MAKLEFAIWLTLTKSVNIFSCSMFEWLLWVIEREYSQTAFHVTANLKKCSQTRLKHRINSAKWKFFFLSTINSDCDVIRSSAQLNYAGVSPALPSAPRISWVQPTRRELNHDDNSTPQDNKSPRESVYPPLPNQVGITVSVRLHEICVIFVQKTELKGGGKHFLKTKIFFTDRKRFFCKFCDFCWLWLTA